EIEHNYVVLIEAQMLHRLMPIGDDFDGMIFRRQEALKVIRHLLIVFDYEDFRHQDIIDVISMTATYSRGCQRFVFRAARLLLGLCALDDRLDRPDEDSGLLEILDRGLQIRKRDSFTSLGEAKSGNHRERIHLDMRRAVHDLYAGGK